MRKVKKSGAMIINQEHFVMLSVELCTLTFGKKKLRKR